MQTNPYTNGHQPEGSGSDHPLDAAVIRALATAPEISIPADFALRVARRAVAQPVRGTSPWAGFGPRIAIASGALLTAALFAFAPHATPSVLDVRFDLEMVALAELGLVGYLLARVMVSE